MTALEKAARAIIDLDGRHGLAYTEAAAERLALRYARAVLMAVREPDQVVIDRGTAQINYDGPAPADAAPDDDYSDDIRRSFTAMIDAILNEEPK